MCGECCRIKDGIVRLSEHEIRKIAAFLNVSELEFIEHWTLLAPDRQGLILKSREDGSCIFLNSRNLCEINSVKPEKCKTFPFEWINPDSAQVCPSLAALLRSDEKLDKGNQ